MRSSVRQRRSIGDVLLESQYCEEDEGREDCRSFRASRMSPSLSSPHTPLDLISVLEELKGIILMSDSMLVLFKIIPVNCIGHVRHYLDRSVVPALKF